MGQRTDEVDALDPNTGSAVFLDAPHPVGNEVTPDDIEQTRTEMSGTIAAIGDKLNPHVIAEEAKDAAAGAVDHAKTVATEVIQHIKETLPEVASEAAHHFVSGVIDTSKDAIGGAVNTAKGAGMTLVDRIKQNPIPAALVGVGLYWMYSNGQSSGSSYSGGSFPSSSYNTGTGGQSIRGQVGDKLSSAADKIGDVAGQVQDKAGTVVQQVQDKTGAIAGQVQETMGAAVTQVSAKAHQSSDWFQRSLQENPMAIGAMAIALGLALGMAVPETPVEHKLMGETRDNLMQKAQDAAQNLGDKVQNVAQEAIGGAKDAAKEAAQNQGLTGAAQA